MHMMPVRTGSERRYITERITIQGIAHERGPLKLEVVR